MDNVIQKDGENIYTIDECLSFTTTKDFIEAIATVANHHLQTGDWTMVKAYQYILTELGMPQKAAMAWSLHHPYGRVITIEDNFWEEES